MQDVVQFRPDLSNPMDCALAFFNRRNKGIVYHQGKFYFYIKNTWVEMPIEMMRGRVYDELFSWYTNNHLRKAPKKKDVDEVIEALKAITIETAKSVTFWRNDSDRDASTILNFQNCLLDVKNKTSFSHTMDFFSLNPLALPYLPELMIPREFLQFLENIWPEDEPSIECLQEMMGLLLTNITSFQKAFMIIGPPRSGKGTLARVIQALVGLNHIANPTLGNLSNQFGLAGMIDKKIAIISDARISGKIDISTVIEVILRVTGEDSISIPRKFLPDWNGKLNSRFLILANEILTLFDSSNAISSRFIMLKMTKSFIGNEDTELFNKLSEELPAIMNWSLVGLERLLKRGHFVQPESSRDSITLMNELGSPINAFISDYCVLEPHAEVSCAFLFNLWRLYCQEQNIINSGTIQSFGRNLSAAKANVSPKQRTFEEKKQRFYVGIRVNPVMARTLDNSIERNLLHCVGQK